MTTWAFDPTRGKVPLQRIQPREGNGYTLVLRSNPSPAGEVTDESCVFSEPEEAIAYAVETWAAYGFPGDPRELFEAIAVDVRPNVRFDRT